MFFLFSRSGLGPMIAGLKGAKDRAGGSPRPESEPTGVKLRENLADLSRAKGEDAAPC
jgi:hypothetical protein